MLKIAIDAGHGLKTAGKRCMKKLDPKQTREWVLNNRVAVKLEALLKGYDCQVLRVDDITGNTDISLSNRAKKANDWGADIFISIHHNAGKYGRKGGGTVVFSSNAKAERLVQAKALYNAIVAQTGLIGDRAKPVEKKAFTVIKKANAPSFLIENGFMDSPDDVPVILSEAHADKTARGLVNYLVGTWGLKKKAGESDPESSKTGVPFTVKIAVDTLNYRIGPGTNYAVKGKVTRGQSYTIVEVSGSWGKLKSGAGWINISEKYVTRL